MVVSLLTSHRFYLSLDNNDNTIVEGIYDGESYIFGYFKSGNDEISEEQESDNREYEDEDIDLDVPDAEPTYTKDSTAKEDEVDGDFEDQIHYPIDIQNL